MDYRWALIIDLDEYLVFNTSLFGSALDFLRWQETSGCDAIALNWVVHSSAGSAQWHDDLIARRFPYPVGPGGGAGAHIKTLCRPQRFIHSTPHYPRTYRNSSFNFAAANGKRHVPAKPGGGPAFSAKPNVDFAWINHYFCKSTEEFLWNWSRNRGDFPMLKQPSNAVLTTDFVQNFMRQFSIQHAAQATPDQCAPDFTNELARLEALPGVAAASARVKQIYAERIQALIPMFVSAPAILEAGDVGQALLRTLGL